MDRGAWQPIVHGVSKTQLSNFHFTSHRQMKQIRKVKKLNKWVSHELTKNQKNHCFEALSSLILCKNNEPFLDRVVMCAEKWILYITTGDDQLSCWTEKKLQRASKSQIHTKDKVMVTVWWSAACLIHYSFLNPCETIISEKYMKYTSG